MTRGEQLDELNRQTLRKHWRGLNDLGTARELSLEEFIAGLRANAELVYGADSTTARRR
jgi:hypothetical protein